MRQPEKRCPPPKVCNVCQSDKVKLAKNDVLYGRMIGSWPWIYFCEDCRSSVGCHPGTYEPLGVMATAKTRKLRSLTHSFFDRIWKEGHLSRRFAYEWLARKLSIEFDDCHISWLTDDQLDQAIKHSEVFLTPEGIARHRRENKKHAKDAKRRSRNNEAFKRRKANGKPRFSRYSKPNS